MRTATAKKPATAKKSVKPTAMAAISFPVKLGHAWPGQGGVFVGTVRGQDGAPDYHLIVGPEMDGEGAWKKCVAWAKKLIVEGFNDFTLPDRREMRFLVCQGEGLFKPEWYWTSTQGPDDSSYAYIQYFGYGHQNWLRKSNRYRARAVRRINI